MQTTLFEVKFYNVSIYKVFCYGKAQKQRFYNYLQNHVDEVESWSELINGIHNIKDFEKRISNKLHENTNQDYFKTFSELKSKFIQLDNN